MWRRMSRWSAAPCWKISPRRSPAPAPPSRRPACGCDNGETLPIDFGAEEKVRDAQQRAGRFASGLAVIAALIAVYGLFLAWQSSVEIVA